MLIDMHNHTRISSFDGRMSPEELIESARDRGLDGVCVTEHFTIEGAEVAREVGDKLKFPVFRGVEARTDLGDMLVFGYYRDVPKGIPFQELVHTVHEWGGVIFAAHPFRREGFTLETRLRELGLNLDKPRQCVEIIEHLDGIEVANGRSSPETNGKAGSLAHRMGLPGIGGSDSHDPEDVGRAITRFPRRIRSEMELVMALRDGSSKPFGAPTFSAELFLTGLWGTLSSPEMHRIPRGVFLGREKDQGFGKVRRELLI
jgi:hypothetical protein